MRDLCRLALGAEAGPLLRRWLADNWPSVPLPVVIVPGQFKSLALGVAG